MSPRRISTSREPIEVDHRGFTIRYDEEKNEWGCYALSMTASSLKAMRQKVNQHDADARRLTGFKAIFVHGYYNDATKVRVVLLIDAKECWYVGPDKKRHKADFTDLISDTPENQKKIKEWEMARDAQAAADRVAERALAAIPRLTRKQVLESKVLTAEAET